MADFLDDVTSPGSRPPGDPRGDAAAEIARLAGKIALDYFERAEVSCKPDDSMVTDADVAVQSWIEDEIAGAFPSDGILGEEGLTTRRHRPDARFVWVIDPVDGTNNFGRGFPGFAVSVGVLHDGMPFAGAVYDPVAGQLFTACRGYGARLNGRRLRAAPADLGPRSLFSIRSPHEGALPGYVRGWLGRYRLRRVGSTALQLCCVATGAMAFVHDHRASLWDVGAAAVIVSEAGGAMTAADGGAVFPIDPHTYAGEPIAFLAGDPTGHRASLADIVPAPS